MKRNIPDGLSIYLDLVRLAAAFIVLFTHVWPFLFPHHPLPWPGHSAVVIFFVLSGFVISHAARPDLGLQGYALHRIARIYPVVLAAALFSIAIASAGIPNIIRYGSPRGSDWLDIGLNLAFLGQSWTDVAMPYVGTLWSLDYEIWYYILFGLWCYYRSVPLLACAALVAGPKILLLMPVWLLGVVLHRKMVPLKPRYALALFVVSLAAGLAFFWFDAGIRIREAMRVLSPWLIQVTQGSNQFVGDFVLGLIVALNFLAAGSLGMKLALKFKAVIRYLSSFTFSLYVFHLPLAVILWNGLHVRSAPVFFGLLMAGVWILGTLTERRTTWYRSKLSKIWPDKKKAAVQDPLPTAAAGVDVAKQQKERLAS